MVRQSIPEYIAALVFMIIVYVALITSDLVPSLISDPIMTEVITLLSALIATFVVFTAHHWINTQST